MKTYIETIPEYEQPNWDYIGFMLNDIKQEIIDILSLAYINTIQNNCRAEEHDTMLEKIKTQKINIDNAKYFISNEDKLKIEFLNSKKNILEVAIKCCKNTEDKKLYKKSSITIEQVLAIELETTKLETLENVDFTDQEYRILALRKKLYSYDNIMRLLCISKNTLNTHVKHIAEKILSTEIGKKRYQITNENNAKNPKKVIDDFIQYGWLSNDYYYKYRQKMVI